jgi:quercetin dioxygenase-like cupin family protein
MKSPTLPPNAAPNSAPKPSVLDTDTLALLSEGVADGLSAALHTPETISPQRQERLGQQIMARIAQSSTEQQLTVAAASNTWRNFLPGIERKVLHEKNGVMSYLLRLGPGAVLPAHHHPVDEECVVLQGSLRIGTSLVLQTGDFHLAHEGLPHDTIVSDEGALIFLRGASPTAQHMV